MVYRGKPSAGCEACRKAKKRCTLELPACARCIKLKKDCSGYRDTTQLQIQDESEAVKRKATRQKARPPATIALLAPPELSEPFCILTPTSITHSDSSSGSDDAIDPYILKDNDPDLESWASDRSLAIIPKPSNSSSSDRCTTNPQLGFTIRPLPAEVATTHFFNQFTANGHWEYLRVFSRHDRIDPCLDLAIRACGMAALDNVEHMPQGRDYARSMYIEALGLLNAALRDPVRSKTDESLIAVAMLGYYENLVCDSHESIASWKAHVSGATQLLRLRGPAQFKSPVGRMLFRETRAQIMIHCIWDDLEPPSFLWDWQDELRENSPEWQIARPADELVEMCFDFARVRARIEKRTISDTEALATVNEIDRRMIQWSTDTLASTPHWRYTVVDVPDNPHIWNGTVHSYAGHPAPGVWNTYRSIRILVTRSQEWLCRRFPFSDAERAEQTAYFRKVRRQMTDDICAGIPPALGHAPTSIFNSPSILISAYGAIWPLFFAGTCALERLGSTTWESFSSPPFPLGPSSAAEAQAAWLLGRLEYISNVLGLKWARGIAAALQGDFTMHSELTPSEAHKDSLGLENAKRPSWVQRMEESEWKRNAVGLLGQGTTQGRIREKNVLWNAASA